MRVMMLAAVVATWTTCTGASATAAPATSSSQLQPQQQEDNEAPPLLNCSWDGHAGAEYTIAIDGQPWARSHSIWLRGSEGKVQATDASPSPTLQQVGDTLAASGSDRLGDYVRHARRFRTTVTAAGSAAPQSALLEVEFALRVYPAGGACIFEQSWPSAAQTVAIGNGNSTDVLAGFPSLEMDSLNGKGFLAWNGKRNACLV
jgi:hypothetical protein